jgi:hypothetical protein
MGLDAPYRRKALEIYNLQNFGLLAWPLLHGGRQQTKPQPKQERRTDMGQIFYTAEALAAVGLIGVGIVLLAGLAFMAGVAVADFIDNR